MATAVLNVATRARFEKLFKEGSIDDLLDHLTWQEFEDFLQYVFECAGYVVEKVASFPKFHVDLHLYVGKKQGKPVAVVEGRRYKTARIPATRVLQFAGAMQLNGAKTGYLITTAGFTEPAVTAAQQHPLDIGLINGSRLLRYIRYVGGSHVTDLYGTVPGPLGNGPLSPSLLLAADAMYRRPPKLTTMVTLANSKGGVAKTTTALNLAFALSQTHAKRVLVIDMDGQSSLTEALPSKEDSTPQVAPGSAMGVAAFFAGRAELKQLVRTTHYERLWVLPASPDMIIADAGGGPNPEYELQFARALHDPQFLAPDGGQFDWILLDTPPAQTIYTRAALAASHFVLIPTNAEALAVKGATHILRTVRTMQALIGRDVKVPYGVITEWVNHANADKEIAVFRNALLASDNDTRLFEPKIPRDPRVDKAHLETMKGGFRTLIFGHGPAATAYEAHAQT